MYRHAHELRKKTIKQPKLKSGLNALIPINFHMILPNTYNAYILFKVLFSLLYDWIWDQIHKNYGL